MNLRAPIAAAGPSLGDPTVSIALDQDPQVVRRAAAGEARAMHAFVSRHERLVFGYLSRVLGPGPHLEDLAQEVFLRALRALPRFDPDGPASVTTWLLTIAARVAIDARRRRVGSAAHGVELASADHRTPERVRETAELRLAIGGAVGELPPEQREVFVLTELHGLSQEEVARTLNVAVGTVKSRGARARERLRELLGRTWEDFR